MKALFKSSSGNLKKALINFGGLLACFFLLLSPVNAAETHLEPLTSENAFALSVKFVEPNEIMASWQIAPDYYLYADKMAVKFVPPVDATIEKPKAAWQKHKILGRFQAYTGEINVRIHLPQNTPASEVQINYQGCSGSGFCYPPLQMRYTMDVAKQTLTPIITAKSKFSLLQAFKLLLTDQEDVLAMLLQQQPFFLLFIFFMLGLFLAFTPCVLPMVPILTSIIVGHKHALGTRKAFFLSLTYVSGMAITYALAGMVAASLGNSLQIWLQQPLTIAIVSGIFVLLALSLFGLYELRFSQRWHNKIAAWSDSHERGTYFGVFCMGILSTLVVSPCVTAPLVGVLIYIGQTGNLLFGTSALFVMGLGMGVPLLLIGTSAGRWVPKSGAWMKAVKEFFGFFMIAMAIWLLSRIVSFTTTLVLFGVLCLGAALYIGWYLPRLIRYRRINQAIGLLIGVVGILLISNALMYSPAATTGKASAFVVVKNAEELRDELAKAKKAHVPVLVDFYADWCESCVLMDKKIFSQQQVQQALRKFIMVRVDLSANTAADRDMLKKYKVIAPPTVLLFGPKGAEFNAHRIIGDVNAEDFLSRLRSFRTASCDNKDINAC